MVMMTPIPIIGRERVRESGEGSHEREMREKNERDSERVMRRRIITTQNDDDANDDDDQSNYNNYCARRALHCAWTLRLRPVGLSAARCH